MILMDGNYDFSLHPRPDRFWGPFSLLFSFYPALSPFWIKWADSEAHHLGLSYAEASEFMEVFLHASYTPPWCNTSAQSQIYGVIV
jgi:hypothetical protein